MKRIKPADARARVAAGALLVSAYPSAPLPDTLSFPEFQKRLPSLPKDVEVIFY